MCWKTIWLLHNTFPLFPPRIELASILTGRGGMAEGEFWGLWGKPDKVYIEGSHEVCFPEFLFPSSLGFGSRFCLVSLTGSRGVLSSAWALHLVHLPPQGTFQENGVEGSLAPNQAPQGGKGVWHSSYQPPGAWDLEIWQQGSVATKFPDLWGALQARCNGSSGCIWPAGWRPSIPGLNHVQSTSFPGWPPMCSYWNALKKDKWWESHSRAHLKSLSSLRSDQGRMLLEKLHCCISGFGICEWKQEGRAGSKENIPSAARDTVHCRHTLNGCAVLGSLCPRCCKVKTCHWWGRASSSHTHSRDEGSTGCSPGFLCKCCCALLFASLPQP